jgi:effector-binding domain-containing protein
MPRHEIEIVAIPEQYLACLRGRGPLSELEERASALEEAFAAAGIEPAGALQARFYNRSEGADADFEICLPLDPDADGWVPDAIGAATVSITPAHHAMATTHAGARDTIADAHAAVRHELEILGYTQAGPASETYVDRRPGDAGATGGSDATGGSGETSDDASTLTVVCYPYAR